MSRLPPSAGFFGVCQLTRPPPWTCYPSGDSPCWWLSEVIAFRPGHSGPKWGPGQETFSPESPSWETTYCWAAKQLDFFLCPVLLLLCSFHRSPDLKKHLTPKLPFRICFWRTSPVAGSLSIQSSFVLLVLPSHISWNGGNRVSSNSHQVNI